MAKVAKSARGESVNFDLLRIKEAIASAPKPTEVKTRENFIDQKFKRRIKRLTTEAAKSASSKQTASIDDPVGDVEE